MTDVVNPKRWQKLAGLLTESVESLNEDVDMEKVMKQAEHIKTSSMMTPRAWNQVLEDLQLMLQGDEEDLRALAYKGWSDEEIQALLDELGDEREVSGKGIWGPEEYDQQNESFQIDPTVVKKLLEEINKS